MTRHVNITAPSLLRLRLKMWLEIENILTKAADEKKSGKMSWLLGKGFYKIVEKKIWILKMLKMGG